MLCSPKVTVCHVAMGWPSDKTGGEGQCNQYSPFQSCRFILDLTKFLKTLSSVRKGKCDMTLPISILKFKIKDNILIFYKRSLSRTQIYNICKYMLGRRIRETHSSITSKQQRIGSLNPALANTTY